jgi:hypothetical protein
VAKSKIGTAESKVFDHHIFAIQYTGDLKEPIVDKVPRQFFQSDMGKSNWESSLKTFHSEANIFKNRIEARRRTKLHSLADLFGLEKDEKDYWYRLAVLLAVKHVPGFKVYDKTKTRERKWNDYDYASLLSAVGQLQKKQSINQSAALKKYVTQLAKDKPNEYGTLDRYGQNSKTEKTVRALEKQISRAKKNPTIVAAAHAMLEEGERLRQEFGMKPYMQTSMHYTLELSDTREFWMGYQTMSYLGDVY